MSDSRGVEKAITKCVDLLESTNWRESKDPVFDEEDVLYRERVENALAILELLVNSRESVSHYKKLRKQNLI